MNKILIKLAVISTALVVAYPVYYVFADQQIGIGKSYKLPPNLQKHFSDKYDIRHISSTVEETPDGPKGYFHINGNIKPKSLNMSSVVNETDTSTSARTVSKAFIDDESDFLGISKKEEVREEKTSPIEGYDGTSTKVTYLRYINGLLVNNSHVDITVGPTKEIKDISADLVPMPSKLFEAAQRETLSEAQIIKIIESDLGTQGKNTKSMKVEKISKYLETESPYVFYGVTIKLDGKPGTRMSFKLDAQTGEILASRVIRYTTTGK